MKRVLFSTFGTVAGVVALLSFKSHSPVVSTAGGLPSAALPAASTPTAAAPAPAATTPAAGASPKPGTSSPSSAAGSAARTLDGQAVETPYGIVQVEVSVTGTKITNAKFLQLTAYDGRSEQINQYAAPILLQETLSAQNANIDTVSGASYTTAGYVQSLQSALDQAGIK